MGKWKSMNIENNGNNNNENQYLSISMEGNGCV
jgi:hypothetical protein